MGVDLKSIILPEEIDFEDLKGKTIAIDALNFLYQFLASIRQPDGTPLMDSKKRITSHLSGLLYRTGKLVSLGIKPIYVFDGEVPELKKEELSERRERKEVAKKEWEKAIAEGRLEDAKKFASRTSRVTEEMKEDSKKLLELMGIPWVHAPSEGEAQCVRICEKGDAWAVASQDYDSLLLGAKKLVRGLTLSKYSNLEILSLEKNLEMLGISREQLVEIGILVGTDFNKGIKGIGPKKALSIVKEGRLNEVEMNFNFEKVEDLFLHPQVKDDYKIEFREPEDEKLKEFLCGGYDFSPERVGKVAQNLRDGMKELSQKDLSAWF